MLQQLDSALPELTVGASDFSRGLESFVFHDELLLALGGDCGNLNFSFEGLDTGLYWWVRGGKSNTSILYLGLNSLRSWSECGDMFNLLVAVN